MRRRASSDEDIDGGLGLYAELGCGLAHRPEGLCAPRAPRQGARGEAGREWALPASGGTEGLEMDLLLDKEEGRRDEEGQESGREGCAPDCCAGLRVCCAGFRGGRREIRGAEADWERS